MGWIDTILSLFGRTSDDNRETGDAEITVEKEPEATTERAVKERVESEQPAEELAEDVDHMDLEEMIEEDVGKSAQEQTSEESEEVVEETDEQAVEEDAEATGETGDGVSVESEDDEAVEAETDAVVEGETAEVERDATKPDAGASVTTIKGIGDAYADRLAAAGVESIDALADADAETLSDDTGISEKRLQRWIDRARET